MEDFEFETNFDELDERSIFANRIFKLIYEKNNGDLDKSIEEAEPYFNDLEEFVRNIYELIYTQIPLYAYYKLLKYGKNNYGFSEVQYKDVLSVTREACRLYYHN
jgi:hypothetical protein